MDSKKWKAYVMSAHLPDSLTSTDAGRRQEAEEYTAKATRGFDKNKSLLVLGCGDGFEIETLRHMGFKDVKGITLLDKEYERAGTIEGISQGDIHELPYEDESFDYVISKETLEHAIAPSIALFETNRVLKKNGKAVHYIPSGPAKQADWYHYGCFPDWVWVDLMSKAGFDIISVTDDIQQIRYEILKARNPNAFEHVYPLGELMKKLGR